MIYIIKILDNKIVRSIKVVRLFTNRYIVKILNYKIVIINI